MTWSEHYGLHVDVSGNGDASVTIRLAGEFDFHSAPGAYAALEQQLDAESRQLIVDLSRVTFFSAAGVRFLVGARKQASAAGGELVVRHPSRAVRRVLELTGQLPLLCPAESGDAAAVPLAADVVSVYDAAVASAIQVSAADMGNAQAVDPSSGALRIVAQRGFTSPFLDFFQTVHDQESACGEALAAGQPVWVPDITVSPIFAGTPALAVMLAAGSRAVASVPVPASDGTILAMISPHRRQPSAWTDGQRQQLEDVAAQTGQLLSP